MNYNILLDIAKKGDIQKNIMNYSYQDYFNLEETNISHFISGYVYRNVFELILLIKDEDLRIKMFFEYLKKNESFDLALDSDLIIDSLKNNQNKLLVIKECLKNSIEFDYDDFEQIISSLSDDNLKTEVFFLFENNFVDNPEDYVNLLLNNLINPTCIKKLLDYVKINECFLADTKTIIKAFELISDDDDFILDVSHRIYLNTSSSYLEVAKIIKDEHKKISVIQEYISNGYFITNSEFATIIRSMPTVRNVIRYFGSNFEDYINISDFWTNINDLYDDMDRIFPLLENDTMNTDEVNRVCEILLTKKFNKDYRDIIGIYQLIVKMLTNHEETEDIYKDIINTPGIIERINGYIHIENNKKILFTDYLKENGYSMPSNSEELLLLLQILNIDFDDKTDIVEKILHDISDSYVLTMRDNYISQMLKRKPEYLNVKLKPRKNDLIKRVIKILSPEGMEYLLLGLNPSRLDKESRELLFNRDLLNECISFKHSPKSFVTKYDDKTFLHALKNYQKILNYAYDEGKLNGICNEYDILEISYRNYPLDLYYIFINLNPSIISEYLLKDEECYKKLQSFLKKYKLTSFDNIFNRLFNELGISFGAETIAEIINYSHTILKENTNLIDAIELARSYELNMFDNVKQILGEDCYDDFYRDGQPYSTGIIKKERHEKLLEIYKKMFKKDYLTVPTFQKEFKLGKQKIMVTLGDTVNPINLVYGEKTGSCMRIFGLGDSLFQFCNCNENGFHIRFDDPETGRFITRVSGFRNGNTIFLNQLRYSTNIKFRDEEIISLLKEVSLYILKLAKQNGDTIDNVLISDGCVMTNSDYYKKAPIKENISYIEGYKYFYRDVKPYTSLIVASTSSDELVPFDFSIQKKRYLSLRKGVNTYYGIDAYNEVKRLLLIERLLVNDSLDINFEDKNIQKAIIGEDFYIYIDSNNQLVCHIIDGIGGIRIKRASIEMRDNLELLKQEMETKKIKIYNK